MSRQVARTIQEPENKPLFSMKEKLRNIPANAQVQVTLEGTGFHAVLTGKHEVLIEDHSYRVWHVAGTLDYQANNVIELYIEGGVFYITVAV